MGRPKIKARLEKEGYEIKDFGEWFYDADRYEIPPRPGVYSLFYGNIIQYIGSSIDLRIRLRNHLDNKYHRRDGYIPFGNYSWYVLNKSVIVDAEDMIIRYYEPKYNLINARR